MTPVPKGYVRVLDVNPERETYVPEAYYAAFVYGMPKVDLDLKMWGQIPEYEL